MKTMPDDGAQSGQQAAPGLDTYEMAARVGSPASFRRSGNVVLIDEFNTLAKWSIASELGGGGYIDLDAKKSYSADMSGLVRISSGNSACYIRRFLPVTIGRRVGSELTFALNSAGTVDTSMILQIGSGIDTTYAYFGAIQFYISNVAPVKNQLYYFDGFSYVLLDSFGQASLTRTYWNNVKIAVDLATLKYISIDFNGRHYDLSTINLARFPTNYYQYAASVIGIGGGLGDSLNVDNFIFTVDEP